MFRRPSGVYFARMAVPRRLRERVGKTELIQSTGCRCAAVAKVIAAAILASWRRSLHDFDFGTQVDILQLQAGSPLLQVAQYLSLAEASSAAGIDAASLLRAAAEGRLGLFIDPGLQAGFFLPRSAFEYDRLTGIYEVPAAAHVPNAVPVEHPGVVQLYAADVAVIAGKLIDGQDCELVAFARPGNPNTAYCPTGGLRVNQSNLLMQSAQVETLRTTLAAGITDEQIEAAKQRARTLATPASARGHVRLREAIDAYMDERSRRCAADQARRVRAACELLAELMGNLPLQEVTRDVLRQYRDHQLPRVPARENKVRLRHGSRTVKESIGKVAGTDWPTISAAEVAKRMHWLAGLFEWLHQEKWIADDPAVGLAGAIAPKKASAVNRARDLFTRDELAKIFSAEWFATGKGKLTRQGTYREFLPYYYWLPLLGLYYGARINELCQLELGDIRQTQSGTWYIDITPETSAGAPGEARKRIKNVNSVRRVPIHPHLIDLGLLEWREALVREGHTRLFPELLHNERKGYSAAAVRWFSAYLGRLGWPRDGKKVFHSFRHTLASECLNKLGLSEEITAQISGHARGSSVLMERYRKDVATDELAKQVRRLDFNLPKIVRFDIEQGLQALRDALRRKKGRT
ncbi:site-specific integrase [Ramlibacter tataouinensis]|uniref:site-specific integrase n=1 Tax=Ramlibacter tataouinensis TaxID=94132 RepID=UPI0022F3BF4B|nr:site-specific integrase [Ramlibacter tataouinensis]WBY04058.1 site-specific integrase [Ramlibacter tataouinensis]